MQTPRLLASAFTVAGNAVPLDEKTISPHSL